MRWTNSGEARQQLLSTEASDDSRCAVQRARQEGRPTSALTLACAFILGSVVSESEVATALPSLGVDGAVELGLFAPVAGAEPPNSLTARLDLRPYSFADAIGVGSWWIASDLGELALGHPLDEDHVLGIGGASVTLSGITIRRPVESVLDLGTGCGIQAMHASRHAARVVATDISARAIDLARFNARLNGIDNIDFRLGSLFEPVRGEHFDQIVSNPPFVITPRADGVPEYEYRDAGMVGDALIETVLSGIGEHLERGGIAQLLGNWEYRSGTGGLERVETWLDQPSAAMLDAWIVEREVQQPAEYAETWIRDGGLQSGTAAFERLYDSWLDDFERRDVSAVGFGYILLRKPAEGLPTLRRLEQLHSPLASVDDGLGTTLDRALAAHDWQAALSDDALGAACVLAAPDVTEERHLWPGADDPSRIILRQGSGFGRTRSVDTALAAFVGACDGTLSIRSIVLALAELLEVDARLLSAEILPAVRGLLDDVFLLPAG